MNNVSRNQINNDRLYDYIPVVSTVSNLYVLFQKYVLKDMPPLEMPDRYYQYLQEKSIYRCVLLLVPILGNILIALHDLITSYNPIPDHAIPEEALFLIALANHENAAEIELVPPKIGYDNQDFVLLAIEKRPADLELASDRLKNLVIKDQAPIVDAAVKLDGMLLRFAGEAPKDNLKTVLLAIEQNPAALEFASDRLKDLHEGFFSTAVHAAVQKDGLLLRFAGPNAKGILLTVDEAIRQNPAALEFACEEYKDEKNIVHPALKKDGLLLKHTDALRDDLETVRIAINQNPAAFEFTSDRLRNLVRHLDYQGPVVDLAVKKDGLLLRFAGPAAKNNQFTVVTAINQNPAALEFAGEDFKDQKDIVHPVLEKDGLLLRYTGVLRDDLETVKIAINQNPEALEFASDRLKNLIENNYATIVGPAVPRLIKK